MAKNVTASETVSSPVVVETPEQIKARLRAEIMEEMRLEAEKLAAERAARLAAAAAAEKNPDGVPATITRTPMEFRNDLCYAKAQAMLISAKGDKATDLVGSWTCPTEILIRDGKGIRIGWKSSDLKGDQFQTASGPVAFWRHGAILSAKGAETKTQFLVLPAGRTKVTLFDLSVYMADEVNRIIAEEKAAAELAAAKAKAEAEKKEAERLIRFNAALENLSKIGFDIETLKTPGMIEALKALIAAV